MSRFTPSFRILGWLMLAQCLGFTDAAAQPADTTQRLLDMLALAQDSATKGRQPVLATFKGTRAVNLQTVQTQGKGMLEFRIQHRFGRINTGAYDLWGLDQAYIRLGFEYGVADWLTLGVSRQNVLKYYDGYFKARLVQQQRGGGAPLTVALMGYAGLNSTRWANPAIDYTFGHRLAYVAQVLLARKFSERLSVQLSPTFLHRNLVATPEYENSLFAVGAAGRFKLSRRLALVAEYVWLQPSHSLEMGQNALSVGFDIETGGHVFSLHFTNSLQMAEPGFLANTTGDWRDGDVHFGFNLTRSFALGGGGRGGNWN